MPFGAIAAGSAVIGTGMSIASSAGAFNGHVDNAGPTPQELEAAGISRKVFNFGRKIQNRMDSLAKGDLATLKSKEQTDLQEGNAVNNVMGGSSPAMTVSLSRSASSSGGPGSGRFAATLGANGAKMGADVATARAGGRVVPISDYLARSGQFIDRKTQDLDTGMNLVQGGADAAASRQAARIGAQVQNNIATNKAMGQIGGALTSIGMSGMSMAGGAGGAPAGSETGAAGQVVDLSKIPNANYQGSLSRLTGPGETYGSLGNIAMAF